MGSDIVSTLLFRQPLPVSSVSLGRLIRDPLYPDVDYYEPLLDEPQGTNDAAADDQQPHEQPQQTFKPNVAESRYENFEATLDASRGTRLELNLLDILSLASGPSQRSSSTTLRSRLCVIRQLRNPDAFFRAACREHGTRAWLESEGLRPNNKGRVYIVCGFKILTDATISHDNKHGGDVDASADVPVATIGAAAGGVPLPLPGSVSTALHVGSSLGEKLAFTAAGERVYAVLYRRIRFSWFSTRSVDNSYLEKGMRWKSFIGSRSDDDEDEEDGIEVEMAGVLEKDELEGRFGSAEIGGEQIFFADEKNTHAYE